MVTFSSMDGSLIVNEDGDGEYEFLFCREEMGGQGQTHFFCFKHRVLFLCTEVEVESPWAVSCSKEDSGGTYFSAMP